MVRTLSLFGAHAFALAALLISNTAFAGFQPNPVVAGDDTLTVVDGGFNVVNVALNDIAYEGNLDIDSVALQASPEKGSVTFGVGGKVVYQADLGHAGENDTFTYTICNDQPSVTCSMGRVTVTIQEDWMAVCDLAGLYDKQVPVQGTFQVQSYDDLIDYFASDYGRGNGSAYQNLNVSGDISAPYLRFTTPGKLTVENGTTLDAESFVSLDARTDLVIKNDLNMDGRKICMHADLGSINMKKNTFVTAFIFTATALEDIMVGPTSHFYAPRNITIRSTGTQGQVVVKKGTLLDGGQLSMKASEGISFDANTRTTIWENASIESIGTSNKSSVTLKKGALLAAEGDMSITGARGVEIGANAEVRAVGALDLLTVSTDARTALQLSAKSRVFAQGDILMRSAGKVIIKNKAAVLTLGTLTVSAATADACEIHKKAFNGINAGTTAGNCLQ